MTFQSNLNAAQAATQQDNIMNSFIKYYIDNELNLLKELILGGAPEALDTLKELADAISSDPDFFQSMADSNAALQTAIDAVQADVDTNEADSDAAIAAEATARGVAVAGEASTRQAAIDAVNALITTLQTEAAARLVRIEALEADPTTATAVAAVQSDVDQNESDSDAADAALSGRLDVLEADPTTQTLLDAEETARVAGDSALSGRLDVLEADPTTETALAVERGRIDAILSGADADKDTFAEIVTLINSVDTTNDNAFAAYVLSNDAAVAAVQSDVDQNESDSDAADAALSARLDVLEADPTTATAVAAVQADVDSIEAAAATARTNLQTTLQAAIDAVQADVNTNEADADTALAGKLGLAGGTLTGNLVVNRDFPDVELKSNGEKRVLFTDAGGGATGAIKNTSSSVGIFAGGVAAGNEELSVTADGIVIPNIVNAANDTDAAAAGVPVNGIYHHNGAVKVRLS